MRPTKNVLMTGAGFTKDFGGYLGDEMWAAILSHKGISRHQKLRQKLLSQLNYEYVYHEVLDSDSYSTDEKSAFRDAVETTYQRMHQNVMAGGTTFWSLVIVFEMSTSMRSLPMQFVSTILGSISSHLRPPLTCASS